MLNHCVLLALTAALPVSLGQVTNDFENGWDQAAWPIHAPDCNQGGTVTLDSSTAHSGKNSIKVTGGASGYCGHAFFGTTSVPAGDVYVRVFLKAETALTDSHVTFIAMPDTAQSGKNLRIGGQNKIFMFNRESDDATLPDLSPQGIAASTTLPTNDWECFEYHLSSDGKIETWLNGNAIAGLTTDASNSNKNGWLKSNYVPKITAVFFGWESYSGAINTIWYDDIVVASDRVGCQ